MLVLQHYELTLEPRKSADDKPYLREVKNDSTAVSKKGIVNNQNMGIVSQYLQSSREVLVGSPTLDRSVLTMGSDSRPSSIPPVVRRVNVEVTGSDSSPTPSPSPAASDVSPPCKTVAQDANSFSSPFSSLTKYLSFVSSSKKSSYLFPNL
jgi:hypothetical protein